MDFRSELDIKLWYLKRVKLIPIPAERHRTLSLRPSHNNAVSANDLQSVKLPKSLLEVQCPQVPYALDR